PDSLVSEERIGELLDGLIELKDLFEHTSKQLEGRISNDPITIAKYNQISNILLHLESDFVDLSMLSGK
ncbi:MAG TPA: hypothetical protein DIW17_04315, partial [Clostridiales bacterium]|nr:hypothetical protein [Clostridiales bacterium]